MKDWHIQSYLLLFTVVSFTVWYLKFLWMRRKLYIYSWNVPGPLAFPIIGMAYKFFGNSDSIADTLVTLIKKYPSPIKAWLGPQLVYLLKDPEQVEKVLTNQKCLAKDYKYEFISKCVGTGLFTAPVPKWKKHRKLIMPAFNQKILDNFVEIFSEQSIIFTDVMRKFSGQKEINISEQINAMMVDIICETAMGLKMNTQGGNCEFASSVEKIMEIINLRIFKIWHHLEWTWRFYPISKVLDKYLEIVHGVTSKVIKTKMELIHKQTEKRRNSLIAEIDEGGKKKRLAFLDHVLENSNFTEAELRDEVEIFLIAGSETSAGTACFCFEMLGLHPEVQKKIYEEVIDVVGEDRPVEAYDLPNLKYVERVIKETLRLFPVGAFIVRITEEDIELGGHVIPEGTSLLFSSLNIHRNSEYYPDPLRFDPDRFLPEEIAKRHPCTFIPFSYGPRNCIGLKYAMMSLKTFVATTVRKYRVYTKYNSIEEIELKANIMIRPKHGYKVYMERR